jgi:hypothetical protein
VHTQLVVVLTGSSGKDNPELHIKSEGKVGMIMLRIKRIRRVAGKKPNEIQLIPDQVRGNRKPGDDCVGCVHACYLTWFSLLMSSFRFGDERPTEFQLPSTWSFQPYEADNHASYVTFVFRYRSPGAFRVFALSSHITDFRNLRISVGARYRHCAGQVTHLTNISFWCQHPSERQS